MSSERFISIEPLIFYGRIIMTDDLSELILYSTAMITVTSNGINSTGTGFFMNLCQKDNKSVPVLVTNRHLIVGGDTYSFDVCTEKNDVVDDHRTMTFSGKCSEWIYHPDNNIDLCVLCIGHLMVSVDIDGFRPYFKAFATDHIPSPEDEENFRAIEEIFMVGYPTGLSDTFNHKPIYRKGITATHVKFDYMGISEFLIDCPCFPGSSGSPVFILNQGVFFDKKSQNAQIGTRFFLLGIEHQTYLANLIRVPQTINIGTIDELKIPNNLGFVIKSKLIRDFEPILYHMIQSDK